MAHSLAISTGWRLRSSSANRPGEPDASEPLHLRWRCPQQALCQDATPRSGGVTPCDSRIVCARCRSPSRRRAIWPTTALGAADRLCNARPHHPRAAGLAGLRGSHVRSLARCGRKGVVCSDRRTFRHRASKPRIHATEGGLLSGSRTADRRRRTSTASGRKVRRCHRAARTDPGSRNRPLDCRHLSLDGLAASGRVARG